MPRCLLNIDLGELPDEPAELYCLAQVANVACGGHAGDEQSMRAALLHCRAQGTAVFAHPSYPDREGFGRRALALSQQEVAQSVVQQVHTLLRLSAEAGVTVEGLKLHGALYHSADADDALAMAILQALPGLAVCGPAGGAQQRAAASRGLAYRVEKFADRGVAADGKLLPRDAPGALITDPAAACLLAVGYVRSGAAQTVCVHGDNPRAVEVARAVRQGLDALTSGSTPP